MALRVTRQLVEALGPGHGKARVTRQLVEVLGPGRGKARVTRQYVEVLAPYAEIYEETIAQQIPLTQSAWVAQQVEASAESPISLDQDVVVVGPMRVSAETPVAIAQAAGRSAFYRRSVDTPLDLSHTAAYIGPRSVDAVNLLTLNHGGRLAETYELSAGHTIPLGQDAEPSGAKRVWVENTIELVQIADTSEKCRSVETGIGLLQSAELERIYCADSHIELGQLAQEGFVDLSAESHIQLSQRARPNPIRIGPGEGFDVDLPGTPIELAQWAETNIQVVSAETQVELDQDLGASVPIHAGAETGLIQTEEVWDQETLSFVKIWVGGLNHEAVVQIAKAHGFHQYLQTTQEAGVVHIRVDAIDLEAQSGLVLDQHITLSETGEGETYIELTDVAVGYVGIPAETEIELDDDVQAEIVRGTNSNSLIGIYHSVTFTLEAGGSTVQYSPFVGESTVSGVPEPPPEALQGPMDGIQVPFQLVYPAVGDATDAVTLAAPNLGNKDRLSFNRIQRETRGGTLIIYADPLWPKVQTLVLSFSGLLRVEAQALLKFMEDHLGEEVGLIDWEHRYWRGVIVTPDEPVIEDRFDCYSASFEFQGQLDPTWNPQVVPPTLRYSATRLPKEDRPHYEPEEPDVPEAEYQDFYAAETDSAVKIGSPIYLKATGHADLAQANGQTQTQVAGLSINEVAPGFGCQYITEGKITRDDWTEIAGTATLAPGATYLLPGPGQSGPDYPSRSNQLRTVRGPNRSGHVYPRARCRDRATYSSLTLSRRRSSLMSQRKPLVIVDGQIQQLQAGDTLDAVVNEVDVVSKQNGNAGALVKCTPVYVKATGDVDNAQANAAATVEVLGLVKDTSIASGASGSIQTDGVLSATTAEWDAVAGTTGGLSPGTVYYLDPANPGLITETAPTATGQYVVRVGLALSETELDISTQEPIKL